ncbi:MAG: hypothetical protein ACLTSZ_01840 [Lachnospiraceae bacterium]
MTVDASEIRAIRLVNLSEAITASYPLVSPSLEKIAAQILETQSLDGISVPQRTATPHSCCSRQSPKRLRRRQYKCRN